MKKHLITAFVFLSTFLYGQTAREIVNRYLDTVSNHNIKNWDKIKSTYTESMSSYSQSDFEQKGSFLELNKPSYTKMYSVLPYQSKHELYDDSLFTHLTSTFYFLKDKTVIYMANLPKQEVSSRPRDEFFSPHLPVQIWKLMEKSKSVELLGTKEFSGGSLCYEIRITTRGRKYLLYINTDTFLLEYWNDREDGDISIMTKLYDYKQVDDFLIPLCSYMTRNGTIYFWSRITKTELNPVIDQKIFEYEK
jgi:hypothetical protein